MSEHSAAGRVGDVPAPGPSVAPPGVGPIPLGAPGEVTVLSPLVRRILAPNPSVMTGPGTNTYLVGPVGGPGDVAVIDPGPDDHDHLGAIQAAGAGRIRWILITHTHHDHWPGAAKLAEGTGANVLAMQGRDGLHIDHAIGDGTEIETDHFLLEAIHTPGHAGNHLSFLLHEERLLFTGDQVMHGGTVVIFPPDGDMNTYLDSLGRLLSWSPAFKALAPAHGLVFDDPESAMQRIIDHRLARETKIASALAAASGPVTVDDLLLATYGDVAPGRLPIARGSLWAHLRKLVDDGLATTTGYDDLEAGRWRTKT